ncbi:PQQ-binding-like beta-propeller repeat protein [Xylanimonas ulmi]|uniref:Putative pyrroloquinoline-quinone binding quinoprotein n=1 Tax=Xylanimonas ulmi TaxID=228973 RepID=A0A4Q7M5M1_9MICO|nr:PQQ-binding-like beta-propeller repeat protein [Xylanibacterium ulmi]RZS61878.1 putative pyrroloquinoline-quinone binding quinoprotein [Xylanibacterium ulmi]
MARRRTPQTVAFDLIPDDEVDGSLADHLAPAGSAPRLRDRIASHLIEPRPSRRRPRAVRVAVATAAVAVVAGMLAADLPASERTAGLAGAPGAVADLSRAPRERWSLPLGNPVPVALMDGLLVVSEASARDAAEGGITLLGVRPRDGAVRWRTHLPTVWGCDSAVRASSAVALTYDAVDRVVCEGSSGVVVVGPGGEILTQRAPEPSDGFVVTIPGPDASRVHFATAPVDAATLTPGAAPSDVSPLSDHADVGDGPWTLAEAVTMPDLRIWREDAATGTVLWERTEPGERLAAGSEITNGSCVSTDEQGRAHLAGGASLSTGGDRVWAQTCSLDVALDLRTGEVLATRSPFAADSALWPPVQPLTGGRYAVAQTESAAADDGPWDVFSDYGALLGRVRGRPGDAWVADAAAPSLLFAGSPRSLVAYRAADGSVAWTAPRESLGVLAQVHGVVVLQTADAMVGLDAATGATRWTRPLADGQGAGLVVESVLTDGDRLVVVTRTGDGGGVLDAERVWAAYDVTNGKPQWTTTLRGAAAFVVGERLYSTDDSHLVALG